MANEDAERKCHLQRVSDTVILISYVFFFQAEDGIRDYKVTGVQTCALPISDFLKLWTGQSISELGSQVSQLAIPIVAAVALHARPFVFSLLFVFGFLPFVLLDRKSVV